MDRTRIQSPARPSAPGAPAPAPASPRAAARASAPAPPPAAEDPAVPPAFDTGVPALLLRLDPNPFHHGTLGAIRSLGRAGVEVHAFVESARDPAGHSRYLHRAYGMPRGPVTPERLAAVLRRTADRIGRPAVLVPMDDLSAVLAPPVTARLGGRYLLPAQPAGLAASVADKELLAALCQRLDIPHPRTVVPADAAEAAAATTELGPPVVAKWSRPWLLPGAASGLRSTTLLRGPDEARRLYARSREAGSRLLLQARLPGGRGADWFFHGCFTATAGCLGGGAGRKDLAWPAGAGLTAVGSWLPNPVVEATAARLAAHLGYRGILDLDFRFDPVSGTYHLLDFNPRPGAQFRIFADADADGAGLDVVRALHLDLTGRAAAVVAAAPRRSDGAVRCHGRAPDAGRVFVAENYALLSSLASLAAAARGPAARDGRSDGRSDGRTGPLGLVRAARGPAGERTQREAAWFAGDDPAPFAAMALAWGGHGVRKGLHRLARARRGRGAAPESRPPVGSAAVPDVDAAPRSDTARGGNAAPRRGTAPRGATAPGSDAAPQHSDHSTRKDGNQTCSTC
ncbi:ATP-grasp domain-containing protein [Streptomyces armeniacus]|uniref:carboxylate--amine ligase n=1 Tax=Streptomyces armeniacus TaxID=83291 RepID=UPI001AD83100|nr:ATP-grasp domain-containing protein [Streptomyces armeniacus]